MTSTDLEIREGVDLEPLPDLGVLARAIEDLVAQQSADSLDEIRMRAEARALYEKRQGAADRERHFGKLRILAEGGLGSLSFDNPDVIEGSSRRATWRALGAAFERGKLLQLEAHTMTAGAYADAARWAGLTKVAYPHLWGEEGDALVRWADARIVARERGIDPRSLPPAQAEIEAKREARDRQSERMHKSYMAYQRQERSKEVARTVQIANDQGKKKLSQAYALLRRCLQTVHDAQPELPRYVKNSDDWEQLFFDLHRAEDAFGLLFRTLDNDAKYFRSEEAA